MTRENWTAIVHGTERKITSELLGIPRPTCDSAAYKDNENLFQKPNPSPIFIS